MAPIKKRIGRPVLEVMRIASSWVLSSHSARKMVRIVIRKIFQSIFSPHFSLPPSTKTFLPSSNLNLKPIFFRSEGTGVFFIKLAKGIVGTVEID